MPAVIFSRYSRRERKPLHSTATNAAAAALLLGLLSGAATLGAHADTVCDGGVYTYTTGYGRRTFTFNETVSSYVSTSGCQSSPNPITIDASNPLNKAVNIDYFVMANTITQTTASPTFSLTGGMTVFSNGQTPYVRGMVVQGFATDSLIALAGLPPMTLTVQNCYFGVNGAYVAGATANAYSGLAVTGALPTNSVVTFSNNTFFGAISTSAAAWQPNHAWAIASDLSEANQVCSLCLIDLALLGESAKLNVSHNAFSYNFNPPTIINQANIYAGHTWVEGGAAVSITDNAFTLYNNNNQPQLYSFNRPPLAQVNFSAITFLDGNSDGAPAAANSSGGGSLTVSNNQMLVSLNTNWPQYGIANNGVYAAGQVTSSPVAVNIAFLEKDGITPLTPPSATGPNGEPYAVTGGNVVVSGNIATSLTPSPVLMPSNPSLLSNSSCNAQFNFTARLSTPQTYYGIGQYGYAGIVTLISTSPVTVLLNYTDPDGAPFVPPEGYVLTGGNITISNNTAGGNMVRTNGPHCLPTTRATCSST